MLALPLPCAFSSLILPGLSSSAASDKIPARSSRFYGNDRSGRNNQTDTGDYSSGISYLDTDTRDAFSNSHDHSPDHAGNGDDTLARKQEL